MFICAGNTETFPFALPTGIGLINSAINLTKICETQKPKELIFLGSAGSYDKNINLLDIFVSQCATQIELSFLANQSYTPLDIAPISSAKAQNLAQQILKKLQNLENVSRETSIINSSNFISTDFECAQKMLARNIALENMEFFSVAAVANLYKTPFAGIFCITNYCDKNAHKDFLANHKAAMQRLKSAYEAIKTTKESK